MPFRRTLERSGRWDVIEAIKRAGGFAAVAQTLGMRASRRPVGYWDDLETVAKARSVAPNNQPCTCGAASGRS